MIIRANNEISSTGVQRSGRLFFSLALMGICLWGTTPACAGMVSGEVRENGQYLRDSRIELKDSMNNRFIVRTDKSGQYRVNLPPGIYRANNIKDKRKRALIQSSPQPSQQNIDLGRR
jgi:hypothetical protein